MEPGYAKACESSCFAAASSLPQQTKAFIKITMMNLNESVANIRWSSNGSSSSLPQTPTTNPSSESASLLGESLFSTDLRMSSICDGLPAMPCSTRLQSPTTHKSLAIVKADVVAKSDDHLPDLVWSMEKDDTSSNDDEDDVDPLPFSPLIKSSKTIPQSSPAFNRIWDDEESSSKAEHDDETTAGPSSSSGDDLLLTSPFVRFAMAIKVHHVIGIDSFSDKEYNKCWYSSEERDKMSIKREKIVVRMDAGKPPKRTQPYRGLECQSQDGYKAFSNQVSCIINAVMNEQDRQWEEDAFDELRISELSRTVSATSVARAFQTGLEDEEDAQYIYAAGTNHSSGDVNGDDSTVGSVESHVARKRRDERRKSRKGKRNSVDDNGSKSSRERGSTVRRSKHKRSTNERKKKDKTKTCSSPPKSFPSDLMKTKKTKSKKTVSKEIAESKGKKVAQHDIAVKIDKLVSTKPPSTSNKVARKNARNMRKQKRSSASSEEEIKPDEKPSPIVVKESTAKEDKKKLGKSRRQQQQRKNVVEPTATRQRSM